MKLKFKHRADNYFWVTALLIFIAGLLHLAFKGDAFLIINVHDTYYVISHFHFTILFTLLYFFIGLVYWILYTLQLSINPKLTKLHAKATTGIVFIYFVGIPILNLIDKDLFGYDHINLLLLLLFAIFILAQPLLLVNIIIGLVRGRVK